MEFIITLAQQIFTLATAVLASGVVTTLLTQALKWKFIKVPAQKYPVQTAIILSVLTSAVAVVTLYDPANLQTWIGWVTVAVGTFLVSTESYEYVHKRVSGKSSK